MEFSEIGLAIWVFVAFMLASVNAMLCRGLGKSTEMNPEFLANMGFFWSVIPAAMFGASAYFPWLDLSVIAPFAFLLGLVPLAVIYVIRGKPEQAPMMFGRDDQGRLSLFACSPEEVVTTVLYAVLAFEICTIFLWDQLYRA
ncbi:MAG: hypothetical protein P8Q36_13660 [Alphaproteobacteria bacterium]|jgi:hypothetical protein|nr:hypothetical protein [Rhodospirillaceae bacterium]MBT6512740.1 hypothetical protein [Rhodospirillaceae bacterium]MBT7612840.1 hypothetical protein [Rhodospirillaceae bacterium]MBT7647807.1 hypothetical protein [Rhodospirillaceae bacterium]MDG2481893.1 hypothetical protein [Alphaproteobacteria bacterium]